MYTIRNKKSKFLKVFEIYKICVIVYKTITILNINKKDLNLGYLALNKYKDRPELVKQVLRDQINIAANKIKEFGLINDFDNPGYLFYSNKSFDYWLEKGFLTIHATVFGGKEGVIISTLIK